MHDSDMRYVAIRENDQVDAVLGDQPLEVLFFENRDAIGIQLTGQFRWIAAIGDVGDLGCRESYNRKGWVVAKYNIEVMEIAASGTQDDYFSHREAPDGDESLNFV